MGISGILLQNDKIVGIYSNKLNKSEQNYTSMEKELLAVFRSLEFFKKKILGYPILKRTDNMNLTKMNEKNLRIHRWKVAISEFDIKWQHVPGKKNNGADVMSRENVFLIKKRDNRRNKKNSQQAFTPERH